MTKTILKKKDKINFPNFKTYYKNFKVWFWHKGRDTD